MYQIWRGNYDLVYGNNFSNPAYIALIASKLLRKPFVWHIREILDPRMSPELARRPRFADAVITVSEASARAIQYHLPGKDIQIVHNGVELEDFDIERKPARHELHAQFGMADEDIVVMSVGHICTRKNQQAAVEAAAKVIKIHPSVKFCFWGMLDHSPEYTVALKEQIARLGIENNIYLPGFRENIVPYLRGADIFLHTAIKDPHPRSVLEGMAAELPVVAFDTDGVSETVVTEKTGYLVSLNDIETLAHRIGELVANPALRTQMGQAGYQRIQKHFTAEQTAQRINTIVKNMVLPLA
jgi:glycosyltransferase involved in cell wall biosynthesis